MQALVCRRYGGPDVLELADVPVPTGGGGVQILQAMLLGAFVSLTSSRTMSNLMAVARKVDLVILKELLETGTIKPGHR